MTYASVFLGILAAAVMLFLMDPILALFGANAETYEFARGYTFHISYGAPFIIWSAAASFIVRAEGASKEAMVGSMIGTIANIVLDPIFISVLDQETAGAAIATTIGNVLASVYYLVDFPEEKPGAFHPMERLYGQTGHPDQDLFLRSSHSNLFRADERVHHCAEPASGGLWQ